MIDNLRIWNAVAKTDPAHTKKVEFGRKFTSIDAHWQIMQATRQFGPIGEGWGYRVEHSIATLAPDMILAVADVTIWWQNGNAERIPGTYGPIRATCEMWGKNEKKGRMEADEDAPKKAMTDALTKGLSHLGFSADVFLGLFDDNRYVQKMQKEFSQPAAQAPDLAQDEDVKQGAINWMRDERGSLNVMTIAEEVKDWRKRKAKPLAKLEANYPDIYEQLMQTYDLALERVTGRVQ
jgi:hypothetical protein